MAGQRRYPLELRERAVQMYRIAAALGVESEQAAQGRYLRKVGNPGRIASGTDGTP